jgi:hypothetical protein
VEGDLKADSILAAEFEYLSQTASQANEDRAKVSTFYVLTVGSFLAAMLGLQTDLLQTQFLYLAFAVLFAILGLNALLTLLQLVRLRQAWYDSALAMNQLKAYYAQRLDDLPLNDAFRWSQSTMPDQFKPWSVSFLLALQVTILGGAAAGATVVFAGYAFISSPNAWLWILAAFIGFIFAVDLIALYWYLLREKATVDES